MFSVLAAILGVKTGLEMSDPLPWEKKTVWTVIEKVVITPMVTLLFLLGGAVLDAIIVIIALFIFG